MPGQNNHTDRSQLPALDTEDLALLGSSLTPLSPRPEIRDRILSRVLERVRPRSGTTEGAAPVLEHSRARETLLVRADSTEWIGIGPGVQARILDDDGLFRTMLLRLQAGSRLPTHNHRVEEECFVVEGDIWLSGTLMRRGDYQRVPAGTPHVDIRTDGGCLLYVRGESSLRLTAQA